MLTGQGYLNPEEISQLLPNVHTSALHPIDRLMASEKIFEARCFAAYFQTATIMAGFCDVGIVEFSVLTDTYRRC